MRKTEMVVMIGIPGCGKSTFQKNFLPYHERINLDSIHGFLAPSTGFNKKNINLARKIEEIIIKDRLSQGISVVVDNTNISRKVREKYFAFAQNYDVKMIAVAFTPDIGIAKKQNKQRERFVPEVVISKMAKDFEAPSHDEGFEQLVDAGKPIGLVGNSPAVFLDRDGVITANKINGKDHFINKPEDIFFLDGVIDGLKRIAEKGYDLYIVSNQGGVGMGIMSNDQLNLINQKIKNDLLAEGVEIKDTFCCTHNPKSNCGCRKPDTGMIIRASRQYGLDPTLSYVIGDMTSDIELGRRIGAETILVETGMSGKDKKFEASPDYVAKNLLAASEIIRSLK